MIFLRSGSHGRLTSTEAGPFSLTGNGLSTKQEIRSSQRMEDGSESTQMSLNWIARRHALKVWQRTSLN